MNDYVCNLKKEFNVECMHQIPRSPYTNVLDLGIWAALQSEVERRHFLKCCNVTALVKSVNIAWTDVNMNNVMSKVFDRIKRVLALINEGGGGNDLVESKWGIKYEKLKLTTN